MADKKLTGLGKKSAVEPAKKPELPKAPLKKEEPKKSAKVGLGKKAAPVQMKIEVKEVPEIVSYKEKPKFEKAAAPEKHTAKLPGKSTGVADKMAKLKSTLKKVVAMPTEASEVKVEEPTAPASTISVTQLDMASTRRPAAAVKKGPVAPGKIGFEEIMSQNSAPVQQAVAPGFFDAAKYLKK